MFTKKSTRMDSLQTIYDHYDEWAEAFDFACRKGCATCCTQSVTMTTLEGELIKDFIQKEKPELLAVLDQLPENSPVPPTTTNRFARACLKGCESSEEDSPWDFTPCLFLRDNNCSIYPVRSFMCRSFGSKIRCDISGCAEVDPLLMTLNTIIMQCIEHLDQGRPWGNMNTILRFLNSDDDAGEENHQTLKAESMPGFLMTPDEEYRLKKQLQILLDIVRKASS